MPGAPPIASPEPAALETPASSHADEARRVAARIGVELPPPCTAGVAQNLALLDEHWASLRGFAPPPA